MQTRSADEPMTTFVLCNECGNRWKVCNCLGRGSGQPNPFLAFFGGGRAPGVVLLGLDEGLPPALGSASPAVLLMLLATGLEGTWCETRCCDDRLGSWGGKEGSGWHQSLNPSSFFPCTGLP